MTNNIDNKIAELSNNFSNKLPFRIEDIYLRYQNLIEHFSKENLLELQRVIHSLAGSAGTFGYLQLSQLARKLEIYLNTISLDMDLNDVQKNDIKKYINILTAVSKLPPDNPNFSEKSLDLKIDKKEKAIYLIDDDEQFCLELTNNLETLGYHLVYMKDPSTISILDKIRDAGAIIINAKYFKSLNYDSLQKKIKEFGVSLITVSDKSNLEIRLSAIRAGSSYFFHKPVKIPQITKLVDNLCGSSNIIFRVLILDDSLSQGSFYSLILQKAGIDARSITDPKALMFTLNEFQPHLLLLDLYMPFCSGLELATILRQEEVYASLPIIFISTEDDKLKQLATISGGGDDFLTKPINPQYLVSAVNSRFKRAAMLSSYIKQDGLTQLLNHTYILQQLELEVIRAEREGSSLSFAMIDIDYFKKINDKFGHLTGDMILSNISEFLSANIEKTNFVGRYGGEEFAIIFLNTTLSEAFSFCEKLREKFNSIEYHVQGSNFQMSFSVGLAAYPPFSNFEELIQAADRALYKAKAAGRNIVAVQDEE